MAKRLNPHRRLLARQAAILAEAKALQSASHGFMAEGRVRSSCNPPKVQLTRVVLARATPWEGRGKSLAKPPKRFGAK